MRESLTSARPGTTLLVAVETPRTLDLVHLARENDVRIERVSQHSLTRLAPDARDAAVKISVRTSNGTLSELLQEVTTERALILVLDHVVDPHNYGAILRSADQFGVDAVVVADRRAAPLTAAVVQASAGTAHHVRIVQEKNIAKAIPRIQEAGFWVYSAEMEGQRVWETNLTGRVALVLGSEGQGVSRLVSERADAAVSIPTSGRADSLNVSVACGVLLYEVRRQQGWP